MYMTLWPAGGIPQNDDARTIETEKTRLRHTQKAVA